MRRTLTIAHLTIADARRRRVVAAAAVCAAVFLVFFAVAVFLAVAEQRKAPRSFIAEQASFTLLALGGLYATNLLSVLFSVLLPVDTLSGEIDSGVMETLASKPIRRAEILLGKWLGHAITVVAYLVVLAGGVLLSLKIFARFSPADLERALPLMMLQVTLLMTVSIAGGTRLSTVTNGVVALGFYGIAFVGSWIEAAGTIGGIQSARTIGIIASLISPPDALWRLAAYHLQPALVRNLSPNVFSLGAVPSPAMIWWAGIFTALTLAWALRSFARRPL
jgi:ABC-type transport system involved in multi-copper enzyme maturation permease subunit